MFGDEILSFALKQSFSIAQLSPFLIKLINHKHASYTPNQYTKVVLVSIWLPELLAELKYFTF